MDSFLKEEVESVVKNTIRYKIQKYNTDPTAMPFHFRLLRKDRLAKYSFIRSLNMNFSTLIFEPVAATIAKYKFKTVKTHVNIGKSISEESQQVIQGIMNGLTAANIKPDKRKEIKKIRKVSQIGAIKTIKTKIVNLYLENNLGDIYLFDIKTPKQNKWGFKEFKRTLLEWSGIVLTKDKNRKIHTLIAIPYNPYYPKPYSRWTMAGMLDLDMELKVAEEFWDFLGNDGTYTDLLDCFEKVGIELRDEIDEYFAKYAK